MSCLMMLFYFLSFTGELPYSQLVTWWKCLQQKVLWQRCLQQRSSWQKYLLTDSFTPDACRSAWKSCPPRLCASAHIFPLPRMSGRIAFNSSSWKLFQGPMMTHLPTSLPALTRHWQHPAVLSHHIGHPGRAGAHISSLTWTIKKCTSHPWQ